MDIVSVDGVNYEKASSLAKDFKYTSDYIGQLCRARKVDAQLVGRTWYVNRVSLEAHRKTRYTKIEDNLSEKTFEYKVKINKSRIDVEPTLSKKTKRLLDKNKNFAKRIDWKPVKYEYDSSDLIPSLVTDSRKINIDLAEANKVLVKKVSKNSTLVPEDLPIVSLSGDLNVVSLDSEYDVNEEVLENKNFEKPLADNFTPSEKPNLNTRVTSFDLNDDDSNEFRLKRTISWLFVMFLSLSLFATLFIDLRIVAGINYYDTSFRFSLEVFQSIFNLFL